MGRTVNYTLEAIHSRADYAGNCYHAFIFTHYDENGNSDAQICAKVSGDNVGMIPFYLNGGSHEPHDYIFSTTEMKIRQFDRLVKGWEYAGCGGEDLAAYIRQHLTPEGGAK